MILRRFVRLVLIGMAISLAVASPYDGRAAAAETAPDAVVWRALNALRESRAEAHATDISADALKQFKAEQIAIAEAAARQGKGEEVLREIYDVASVDDLQAVGEVQLYLRFIGNNFLWRPEVRDRLLDTTFQPLGQVPEGEAVHVVYRATTRKKGQVLSDRVYVVTATKAPEGWRLSLIPDVQEAVTAMKLLYLAEE